MVHLLPCLQSPSLFVLILLPIISFDPIWLLKDPLSFFVITSGVFEYSQKTNNITIIFYYSTFQVLIFSTEYFGVKYNINLPYYLKYSPGLELNPVSNWTRVNLPMQIEKFKSLFLPFLNLSPGDYGPWN